MELRVLRGNPPLVVCDVHQRVGAGGAWCAVVAAFLGQSPANFLAEPEQNAGSAELAELPVLTLPFVNGVRLKFLTSASSAARSAECGAGGGFGRNWLGELITKSFQLTSFTPMGFVPFHSPSPVGTVPFHLASLIFICSMTRAAMPATQSETGRGIAWKRRAGEQTRARCVFCRRRDALSFLRIEVRDHGRSRAGCDRHFARIGRRVRWRQRGG